jgi:AbrB family looped-hinge helix DNA binding protein
MQEATVMHLTISSKGWVVIPSELRKKYNLKPGARVRMVDYGGVLAMVPEMQDAVSQGYGMLKGSGSLTKALLQEHRAERTRDR